MGIYGNILYGGGDYYGQRAKLAYSAEPMVAAAVDHDKVLLNWAAIDGSYTGVRLVRNQSHMPANEEDGVIIWEWVYYDDPLNPGNADPLKPGLVTTFVDGIDNLADSIEANNFGLVGGKFAYYKIFAWTYLNQWLAVGSTSALVPERHFDKPLLNKSTHSKMLELLPRVFTSIQQSPTAEVDYTSDLAVFLEAFSLTYDEALTYLSLIQPSYADKVASPEVLKLQSLEYALPSDIGEVTHAQKQLAREAIYMYQRKGTATAINTLAEAATGFDITLNESPNLLFSMEDSTFYQGVGNWLAVGNCTISSSHDIVPSTAESKSYDNNYVGKVVISTTDAKITNGKTEPIKNAIPVVGGSHTFSYYAKSASGTIGSTPTIRWYNAYGTELSSAAGTSLSANSTTWQKKTLTAVAPGFIGQIVSVELTSNVATLTFTKKHPFAISDSIVVAGAPELYNGTQTVTAVTDYTVSYALTSTDENTYAATGTVKLSTWTFASTAAYASVEIAFGATGTLYLDLIQFSETDEGYQEPRGIDVLLNPGKVNYIKNPAFNSSGTAWFTATPLTFATDSLPSGFSGGYSAHHTFTSTSPVHIETTTDPGLTPGFYCFSIWVRTDSDDVVIGQLSITATNDVTTDAISFQDVGIQATKTWQKYYVNTYIPEIYGALISEYAPKIRCDVDFNYLPGGGSATVYYSSAQLERTARPTDYIDGNLPSEYGAGWYGTANESASYAYPDKDVKISRLASLIGEFLPFETPWSISTVVGVEETGIS